MQPSLIGVDEARNSPFGMINSKVAQACATSPFNQVKRKPRTFSARKNTLKALIQRKEEAPLRRTPAPRGKKWASQRAHVAPRNNEIREQIGTGGENQARGTKPYSIIYDLSGSREARGERGITSK